MSQDLWRVSSFYIFMKEQLYALREFLNLVVVTKERLDTLKVNEAVDKLQPH